MPRRSGHPDYEIQPAKHHDARHDTPTARRAQERLSPAKQRIAEALAALLVAHYRRQLASPDREPSRPPVA